MLAAVQAKIEALQAQYPGRRRSRTAAPRSTSPSPTRFRVGHEAHFAQVTANFLEYLRNRSALPAWERPNMLAKYYVTTTGTEMSRQGPSRPAPRIAR